MRSRQATREEFAQIMFRDVEKQAGRFIANIEKWGDDEQFPKAVYEMAFPGIEKMPIRNAFPYFKSFLSCSEGIVSVDFVLRDLTPVMRIHYVKSMWNDEKLWKELPSREVDAPHGRRDLQGGRSAAEVRRSGQDRNRIK